MAVSQGSSAASSANSTGSEGGQGGGGAGPDVNVNELLENFRQEMETPLSQGAAQINDLRQQNAQTQKVLERIKAAVSGDEGDGKGAGDPIDTQIEHLQGQVDQYIAAAIEAERRGKPIPLTVNSALEGFQGQIMLLKQIKTLQATNKELTGKVDRVSNPGHMIDQQAYAHLDSAVLNALNTVYGTTDDVEPVKEAQFKAVTSLIGKEINDLRANNPELWDRIRRNPQDQQKLVSHYVKQVIPPRARQLLEDEQVKKTPLTLADLQQAWKQTEQIEDQESQRELRAQLRPKILEHIYARSRGQRGQTERPRANDLF